MVLKINQKRKKKKIFFYDLKVSVTLNNSHRVIFLKKFSSEN